MKNCTDWKFVLHGGETLEYDEFRQDMGPAWPDHICAELSRFEVKELVKKWLPELLDPCRPPEETFNVCWLGELVKRPAED